MTERYNDTVIVKPSTDKETSEFVHSAFTRRKSLTDEGNGIPIPNGGIGVYKLSNVTDQTIFIAGNNLQRESVSSDKLHDGMSAHNLISSSSSYALLRTNPKLTGNVKVVIDSKSDMYMDTFKVNDAISKRKYRHVPISYKEYYGSNLMSVFKDITANDFYYVPDKYKSLFTTVKSYNDQYVDTYRCGASTNRDNLYPEALSIFAPLRVGENLPDFFVVFRVEGSIDQSLDSTDTLKKMIRDGKQIKAYDLRSGSKLGTYIQTMYDQSTKSDGYVYVSRDLNNHNMYSGISLYRGVVATAHESTSFAPDTYEEVNDKFKALDDSATQVKINNYYTQGFERNELVAADILNLEFLFDDPESDRFSINTYYGLYLKCNDIAEDFIIEGIGPDGKIVFSDTTFAGHSGDFDDDMIVGYTSDEGFIRAQGNEETVLKDYTNKHGENILSITAKKLDDDMKKYSSFISFTVNNVLSAGEHLRVICHKEYNTMNSSDVIFDVILTNTDTYLGNKHSISDDSITYYQHEYTSTESFTNRSVEIHRIACSIGNDPTIESECDSIYHAFRSFTDAPFESISIKNNTITIGIYDSSFEKYEFERITSNVSYSTGDKTKLEDDEVTPSMITFFGSTTPNMVVVNPMDEHSILYNTTERHNLLYSPFNYEILGPRQIFVVGFVNIKDDDIYEINPSNITDELLYEDLQVVNGTKVEEYSKFKFTLGELVGDSIEPSTTEVNIISSIYRPNLMMVHVDQSYDEMTTINLYKTYKFDMAVCGILGVKDYDFNVYEDPYYKEKESQYIDVTTKLGDAFNLNDAGKSSEIQKIYNNGIRYMTASLVSPHCVKWCGDSTIYTNGRTIDYVLNNMLPLTVFSLSDVALANLETVSMSKYVDDKNIRELIMCGKVKISDIINGKMSTSIKTDCIDNTGMLFMMDGLQFKLSIEDDSYLKLSQFKNYDVFMVKSEPCGNTHSKELFIDTVNRDILIVLYSEEKTVQSHNITMPYNTYYYEIRLDATEKDIYEITEDCVKINVNGSTLQVNKKSTKGVCNIIYTDNIHLTSIPNGNKDGSGQDIYTWILTNKRMFNDESTPLTYDNNMRVYDIEMMSKNYSTLTICTTDKSLYDTASEIMENHIFGTYISNSDDGYTDITNIVGADIIKVEPEYDSTEPTNGGYVKCWYSPKMMDVISFDKPTNTDLFINPYIGHLKVKEVSDESTIYFNKVSGNANYCIGAGGTYSTSVSKMENYKIMTNCFASGFYNKYTKIPQISQQSRQSGMKTFGHVPSRTLTDIVKQVQGHKSGYLVKTFMNSLAINTKKSIEPNILIDFWSEVFVKDGKIYFNITDSLINKMLSMQGYSKSWSYIKGSNSTDMKLFITNSIIPYLNISNQNTVTVYRTKSRITSGSKYKLTSKLTEEVKNIKKELIRENGKYYIVLSPSTKTGGVYYITYNISQ